MKYAWVIVLSAVGALFAQDAGDKVNVPLSDPSRPGTIRVDLVNGSIEVKTHPGKDIQVEMTGARSNPRRSNSRRAAETEGLKRIDMFSGGLDIEEKDNVVRIGTGLRAINAGVVILVPQNTSLKLKTMTGKVDVEGVNGEIEANSMNGGVTVTNVGGTVVAHSLNGRVTVSLNRVAPDKPMSFSTMNGDIDVTMPASTRANLRLKNDHGEVWTDFDMKLESAPNVEQGRSSDGKYKVKFERTVTGTINGGGPDMSFTTMNGQIRIRKSK
jgi:DUF4097 and DUF4098 domain-containing protein YvlB